MHTHGIHVRTYSTYTRTHVACTFVHVTCSTYTHETKIHTCKITFMHSFVTSPQSNHWVSDTEQKEMNAPLHKTTNKKSECIQTDHTAAKRTCDPTVGERAHAQRTIMQCLHAVSQLTPLPVRRGKHVSGSTHGLVEGQQRMPNRKHHRAAAGWQTE